MVNLTDAVEVRLEVVTMATRQSRGVFAPTTARLEDRLFWPRRTAGQADSRCVLACAISSVYAKSTWWLSVGLGIK